MDVWRSWVFWIFIIIFILVLLWLFCGGEPTSPDLEDAFPSLIYQKKEVVPTPSLPIIEMPTDFERPQSVSIPLDESFTFQTTEDDEDDSDVELEETVYSPPRKPTVLPTRNSKPKAIPAQQYQTVNLHPHQTRDQVTKPGKQISKGERELGEALFTLTGRRFQNQVRPQFLRSPETGRNLELDWFCEEIGIAAEFNGIQHYEYPNWTNQTQEEFINQHRRDAYKLAKCNESGIFLLVVPYHWAGQIEQYLRGIMTPEIWDRIQRGRV